MSSSNFAGSSSSSTSGGGNAKSSTSSSSYTNSQGAGGDSSASALSPSGESSNDQVSNFVSGANSAGSTARANASNQVAATKAEVEVDGSSSFGADDTSKSEDPASTNSEVAESAAASSSLTQGLKVFVHFARLTTDVLKATESQDLFYGSAGTDTFVFASSSTADLSQADVILDFQIGEDTLDLGESFSTEEILSEVVDLNGDGLFESTAIRSLPDNTILGIVANTVDADGHTLLSTSDFLFPSMEESVASPRGATPEGSSTTSSSASSVDADRATGSSTATATSPDGETSISQDSVSTPGATSSSTNASAAASEDGLTTEASASAPATTQESATTPQENSTSEADQVTDLFLESQNTPVDFLIGLAEDDVIVGTDSFEVMYGREGADRFELSTNQPEVSPLPDLILDFSVEQGDSILISEATSLNEIGLETIDLNQDGNVDGVLINNTNTEAIYGILLNAPDLLTLRDQIVLDGTVINHVA